MEGHKAGNDGLLDMEKELTCSICTDVLYQPLTLLDCLHTFCGSCLKEWFAFQAASAANNRRNLHPYTCPSCRESVRDTKADWRLTTLLEGFLKANPNRSKSEEEKEEMRKHYKPGDCVIPKLELAEGDSEDERLMAEVREMSMADVDPETARRRAERAAHRRHRGTSHLRAVETGRSQQTGRWTAQRAQLSEATLRQHDAGEPRIEHQSSLRSLLSAGGSPVVPEDLQEEILQSIYAEGLLDGIDTENMTTEEEEELTERIAEAYRRRQRRRDRSGNRDRRHEPTQHTAAPIESTHRNHARTDSASAQQTQPRNRPPISRPHLFEQQSPDPARTHGRSSSATSQRSSRSNNRTDGIAPAARSATDLSERPTTAGAERERHRRLSTNARSATDPADQEMRSGVARIRASSANTREVRSEVIPTSRAHPPDAVRRQEGRPNNNSSPSLLPTPTPVHAVRPAPSISAFAPEPVVEAAPSVKCDRCEKPDIQHDLHYHCPWCRGGTFNLCRSCYRDGRGCDHWYGFGYMAHEQWHRLAPPEGYPANLDRPHVLKARRYIRPEVTTAGLLPQSVLQEGAFCESCAAFADHCYWHCYGWHCLEGAWGYCDACVQQGRHCTHALLPIAHISTLRPPHNVRDPTKTSFVQLPHLRPDSYVVRPVLTDCDVCRRPIPPNSTRFHCNKCSRGDYDICTECYFSLVATGKISQANGPNGWRRCLQGHRMSIVGYQDVPEGGQVRVTVRDLIGGWRHKDDESPQVSAESVPPPPADSSLGMRCVALWSYFPRDGVTDELAFPKNAEIKEVEDRNGDWFLGTYAGQVKLLPSNHVRRL